ncbi:MAG: DUF262 domain-containing protein [Bacteroidia bacterium]|nr:DUF262 domain-containing protein [Bacteroidia bacterium]
MENSNNILLKSISELLSYKFFIPSYQRGYRWTAQQVTDLLNDINEFSPKEIADSNDKTWYCLQPIVVKQKDENEWDVIDGQQRLTTTYLILHHLNQGYVENRRKSLFGLKYETRENSAEYLKNELNGETINDMNIDYHFISSAYKTICDWFKNKGQEFDLNRFESKFNLSTKVIWYETSKNEDSIDIFTRINSGKIPLTNAELIKALFLNRSNFANADEADEVKLGLIQREIASEWDRMEYALQDDSFWYFINKSENNLATRIEFIFNLMYETSKNEFGNDEYATFRYFNEKFKTKSENEINDNWQGINDNWKEIKKYFQTLEEWYNDRELYHKIGYLIAIGTNIKNILNEKKEKSKTAFIDWIDKQISEIVKNKTIDDLEYRTDNAQLIKVLLLHNILTTLKSEDASLKFPFDKNKDKKNGGWSLEHIHAQNSDTISEIEDFNEWQKAIDKEILTEEIKDKLSKFEKEGKKEDVPLLVAEISNLFGEIDIHSVENMALLSKNDNSKLNNGLFPVKRERIIKLEKNGAFIPIATKKVFQKYYDGCTKQISKWEENDRIAYLNDIKETLKVYLPQTESVENEQ